MAVLFHYYIIASHSPSGLQPKALGTFFLGGTRALEDYSSVLVTLMMVMLYVSG